jgi:hypothetical protein
MTKVSPEPRDSTRPRRDIQIMVDNHLSSRGRASWTAYLWVDDQIWKHRGNKPVFGYGSDPASAVMALVNIALGKIGELGPAFDLTIDDLVDPSAPARKGRRRTRTGRGGDSAHAVVHEHEDVDNP